MLVRVVDLETTGLLAGVDGIVNLAWADMDTETGQVWNPQEELCDPGVPIPPGASGIHHITDEDVAGKPHASSFMPALLHGPSVMVAYNVEFEQQFLTHACGGDMPVKTWLCAFRLARHMVFGAPNHKLSTIRYYLKVGNIPALFARTSHQALADVFVTCSVLHHLLKQAEGHYDDLEDLVAQTEQPAMLQHVSWGQFMGKNYREIPTGALLSFARRNFCRDVTFTCKHWLNERGIKA